MDGFSISPDYLERIECKSYFGTRSITIDAEASEKVFTKTKAKERRAEKYDAFVEFDEVNLVLSFESGSKTFDGKDAICGADSKKKPTLLMVKKLWAEIKSGRRKLVYNCAEGKLVAVNASVDVEDL